MTEAEWLTSYKPGNVFCAIGYSQSSNRKLLLFCIHCCFLDRGETDPDIATCKFADLWRLTARFAEGLGGGAEVLRAWGGEDAAETPWPFRPSLWAWKWVHRDDGLNYRITDATVTALLRDIFGKPFRIPWCEPAWLTTDVLALARGIYDDKAFDRMPILADALQDAGCTDDDVLAHCRDTSAKHVRGCWVLDLLLGKS